MLVHVLTYMYAIMLMRGCIIKFITFYKHDVHCICIGVLLTFLMLFVDFRLSPSIVPSISVYPMHVDQKKECYMYLQKVNKTYLSKQHTLTTC